MALEDAVRFLLRASGDAALSSRLKEMTPSSVADLAAKEGFSFTEEEFLELLRTPGTNAVELSEDSLSQVSGGHGSTALAWETMMVMAETANREQKNARDLRAAMSSFNALKASLLVRWS
jgi:predicted ribosomally synthesized peptide with nif11-like leader